MLASLTKPLSPGSLQAPVPQVTGRVAISHYGEAAAKTHGNFTGGATILLPLTSSRSDTGRKEEGIHAQGKSQNAKGFDFRVTPPDRGCEVDGFPSARPSGSCNNRCKANARDSCWGHDAGCADPASMGQHSEPGRIHLCTDYISRNRRRQDRCSTRHLRGRKTRKGDASGAQIEPRRASDSLYAHHLCERLRGGASRRGDSGSPVQRRPLLPELQIVRPTP